MFMQDLTRRSFLHLVVTCAGATALAACAPKAPEAPKATEAPKAAEPTKAAPAATKAATTAPVAAPKKVETLSLMLWGGTDYASKVDQSVRSVHPELNEESKIEFRVVQASPEGLRLALAAGADIPDMVQFNSDMVPEFASAGVPLVVDDVFATYAADLYPSVLEASRYNGHHVCFVDNIKTKIFYYREDKLEEAGIKLPDLNTVDGLMSSGQAFHQKHPKSYLLNLGPNPAGYYIGMLISAYSDMRYADDNGKYLLTEINAFSDSFKFLKDVVKSGIALPIDDWATDWGQAFADESICGQLSAVWMKFFMPAFAPSQVGKWRAALWPALSPLSDQRYGCEGGAAVFIVPKQAPHPELAVSYLTKAFLDKDGAMASFKFMGRTPLNKSLQGEVMAWVNQSKKPEAMSDEEWDKQPTVFYGPDVQQVEFASYDHFRVPQYDPSSSQERTIANAWFLKYLGDQVDLKQALASAQSEMEQQIGNPYKK